MADQAECTCDLFISYAEADRAWVEGYLLDALGLPPDCVITRQEFHPGAAAVAEFERAVTGSRYTVLVLSPAYLADEWSTFGEQWCLSAPRMPDSSMDAKTRSMSYCGGCATRGTCSSSVCRAQVKRRSCLPGLFINGGCLPACLAQHDIGGVAAVYGERSASRHLSQSAC